MFTDDRTKQTKPHADPHQGAVQEIPPSRVVEPVFDGKQFTYAEPLLLFVLESRQAFDAPDVILVLDRIQGYGFAGTMGGFLPAGSNPFHGFHGRAPILPPSEADRKAVRFQGDVPVSVATGEQLKKVGYEESPHVLADGPTFTWYFDEDAYTIYMFVTGFRSVVNRMDAVIRVPRPDEAPSAAT